MKTAGTKTADNGYSGAMRHELKHQIAPWEALVLSKRLERLFLRDRNAGPDGRYRVSSLYFDTPYDDALREKLDGTDRREKFRLRYYGSDTAFIRVEKKSKLNGMCLKRTAQITCGEAQALINGSYDFLLKSNDPLLVEFYSKLYGRLLRPKTVIVYDREAYVYPLGNVRITLDRNVRSGSDIKGFLEPNRFYPQVYDIKTILEVKYDAFLPRIVEMAVQVPNRQAAACSKYALCRRLD